MPIAGVDIPVVTLAGQAGIQAILDNFIGAHATQQTLWAIAHAIKDYMVNMAGTCWTSWNNQMTLTTSNAITCGTGSGQVWQAWNNVVQVQLTSTTQTTAVSIWADWNQQQFATPVTIQIDNNTIWNQWMIQGGTQIACAPMMPAVELTPEQRQAQERQQRENEARWARESAERAERAKIEAAEKSVAKGRARKLLMDLLNEAQRTEYEASGNFMMEVGGKLYKFKQGRAGNVFELDKATKREVRRYCIQHTTYETPDEDNLLAQKLLLEANEPEFRRIANMTELRN